MRKGTVPIPMWGHDPVPSRPSRWLFPSHTCNNQRSAECLKRTPADAWVLSLTNNFSSVFYSIPWIPDALASLNSQHGVFKSGSPLGSVLVAPLKAWCRNSWGSKLGQIEVSFNLISSLSSPDVGCLAVLIRRVTSCNFDLVWVGAPKTHLTEILGPRSSMHNA